MPSLGRLVLILFTAVVVSLAMVLLITARTLPDREVLPRYGMMVMQDTYEVRWVNKISETFDLGSQVAGVRKPPDWLVSLAVVWHRANPPSWWWLPLVFIGVRMAVGAYAARRRR